MKECLMACRRLEVTCPVKECKYWIKYRKDYNCSLETISKNGQMTYREVAERLGISYVRVKQIQDKALKKISHLLNEEAI